MKVNIENLTGKFLVAVPGLEDTHFNRAVVLVCEHSQEGAFGLIINKVLMNSFKPLLDASVAERLVPQTHRHTTADNGPNRDRLGAEIDVSGLQVVVFTSREIHICAVPASAMKLGPLR